MRTPVVAPGEGTASADATIPTASGETRALSDAPRSARVSRAPPSARGVGRRRPRDFEDRRRALPQVFLFLLAGWCAFSLLDVYVALVVAPGMPLVRTAAFRAAGAMVVLVARMVAQKGALTPRTSTALEVSTFLAVNVCLSLIAVGFGGLASHYVHGVSILVVVEAMALPGRWRRTLVISLLHLACFPAVMAVAAAFEPMVRAQWASGATVAQFAQDYVLVIATAVGSAVGGHLIWAARRQVYHARRLGRYRLKARIGSGGMGEVWLAYDESLKRNVALKILSRQASATELARFEREALAASALQSPHTIRVFDFGASDDGVWFIAMEHLHGVDLATLVCEHGPLPPARAVRFARQACESLAEAHERGIIHRDIKPANLFVTHAGEQYDILKLLDFGIAKVAREEEDATVTTAGWLAGTPAYMSPEVCSGAPADPRSDIYSLGAVLYFLLTGSPPFTTENVAALMMAHVHEAPETPSQRAGTLIPRELEDVVLRCLEKRPDARFARVQDLDVALASCSVGRGWTRDDASGFWAAYREKPWPKADGDAPTLESTRT